ncbi:MAG: glycosyltransferase family 4 protein [Aquabacterium sp.]|nr:glycosyltransferase family 4 protein [Aquabacterium sp.]
MSNTPSSALSVLVVLSNWSYPGQEGLHLQNAAVLRQLCHAGWRVHVLAFVRAPATVDVAQLRADFGPNLSVTLEPQSRNYPLLLAQSLLTPRWADPCLRVMMAVHAKVKPDLVHLEGIGIAPWIHALPGQVVLMSAVDAWSLRQSRLAQRSSGLKRLFFSGYAAIARFTERRYYAQAAAVHVVSDEDAAYLQALCPAARVRVVPVGLMAIPPAQPPDVHASPGPMVFWGDLKVAYLRDGLLWLLQRVLPLMPAEQTSNIELEVLGRREPDTALLTAASGYKVSFRQWVDDANDALSRARVVLLPDASGSGMKNRTLQAMACGVPVVGTSFAFEGVGAQDGISCFMRDDPQAFALALSQLLSDQAKATEVGLAGRQMVLTRYNMSAVVAGWCALYTSCMNEVGR